MFYSTQIKSVGYGGAYDVTGKWLTFIGYLPVKVDDTVFTDGNIIFGNVPPRGSAMNFFFKKENGIPVLSADLRGFFTKTGVYRPYLIAGDDWIVNSQKYYAHDNGEENILDAEISLDSDGEADGILTAEKNVQQNDDIPDDDLFSLLPEHAAFYLSYDDCDFCKYDDTILKDCEIIRLKDNQVVQQIAMANLTSLYENAISDIAAAVVVPNRTIEDHLQSRAKLLNFKLGTNDQWAALLLVDVCATRSIGELQVTALKFETDHNVTSNEISLDQDYTDLSGLGLPANLLARVDNIRTSLFGVSIIDVWSEHYYVTVVDGDTTTLPGNQIFPHHSFLAKLSADNQIMVEPLAENKYCPYKYDYNLSRFTTSEEYFAFETAWDSVSRNYLGYTALPYRYVRQEKDDHIAAFQDDFEYIEPHLSQEETDAVFNNQYYNTWTTVNSSERIYIELVADAYSGDSYAVTLRARTQILDVEDNYHFTRHTIVRIIRQKNLLEVLPDGNISSTTLDAVDSFTFPIQDDFTIKIYQSSDNFLESTNAEILHADNVIISQSQIPELSENVYELNLCICPLTAGYLVGAHGKHLYTILNNVVKEVDDELKNFRLRELNPISIAKV